jgi:D-alanine-D-alanine ligase
VSARAPASGRVRKRLRELVMAKKLHVVILVPEMREIAPDDDLATLSTGHEVAEHYAELGHKTSIEHFEFDPETFKAVMQKAKPDCVFNLVESVYARSRLTNLPPVYLEELRLPYTGNDSSAMFTTNDKVLAKSILRMLDLPSPNLFVRGGRPKRGKWIVKARHEHASFGITQENVVDGSDTACTLADRLTREHEIEWIIESFVDGREFNVSIIETRDGPRVLPVAEIQFQDYADGMHKIVDYKAKWDNDSFESLHTVRSYDHPSRDKRTVEAMKDISLEVWNGFGMGGWGRLDFRVDADGKPWIVDINANPDPSLDAGFMAAAQQAGISPARAVDHITDAAFRAAAQR